MRIKIDLSALGRTRWYEFGLRFLVGGLITALAGVIAQKFGPRMGGLFLAFPAIFPASATLIEKHEKQKKECAGLEGTMRGRKAAGVDAAGAAIGSVGLLFFAFVVQRFLTRYNPWLVLTVSTVMWLTASLVIWQIRERT